MSKPVNAGKYNRKIVIYEIVEGIDSSGFPVNTEQVILTTYAEVKTLRGYTLITNNSDFDKAYVNFTIRYSQAVYDAYYNSNNSNRDILINFRDKVYKVEYLNNIDFANVELEIQAKEVTH
jgi:head-tail adaptor